ncbi:phage Gp37/Gp68 family protein [Cypionkella sp.]|uniref:DUF5131 family protein n=1 Tax=Cypionkella sp. TaxID=2811411 RepID=UPI002ABC48CC|nr:phage Gp37/Gp68 family protein [Cypionkella sp.]MDZ4393786.1 phage Gp37/Gp68 family protein [Cypionkella sp.]
MADKSLIEWTDATWNPITGCTLVDDGCRHCYAAHLITSWHAIGNHPSRKGLARKNAAGESKFTGEVRFNEGWLDQPLSWKKPRRIFVCAHGDLFHPSVPDEWIDKVFAVMALASQHTFQVLTKRPERALEYLHTGKSHQIGMDALGLVLDDHAKNPNSKLGAGVELVGDISHLRNWPLPNVWLGTSVSDQASADLRIPNLLSTPAAVRFISAEPLLGPVDLTRLSEPESHYIDALLGDAWDDVNGGLNYEIWGADKGPKIDWVIVGGESGPHARPMHPDWARSLRDQCVAAGVPFLFKQWGEWGPDEYHGGRDKVMEGKARCACLTDSGEWNYYPNAYIPPLDGSVGQWVFRHGKKAAGRLLDGVEWSQFPEVAA